MDWKRTFKTRIGTAAAGLACCLLAQATVVDGVIESYSGSRDLPDEIAYSEFLNFVGVAPAGASDRHVSAMMIAEALGLDPVREAQRVKARAKYFRWQLKAMEREERRAGRQLLCRQGLEDRTDNELFDALNAVDDLSGLVRRKFLLLARHTLPIAEQTAFATYLDEFKESVSYTRYDSRRHAGDTTYGPGPAQMAEEICRSYRAGSADNTEGS